MTESSNTFPFQYLFPIEDGFEPQAKNMSKLKIRHDSEMRIIASKNVTELKIRS